MIEGVHSTDVVWRLIRKHVDKRIDALRGMLELNRPAEETASIRGQIAELRELIRTVEAPSPIDPLQRPIRSEGRLY